MNPCGHIESEKTRIQKKRQFFIDNMKCLFEHSHLYPMISRKGKYISGKLYNHTKEKFIKKWRVGI